VVGFEPTSGISLKRAPTGLAKEIFWGRVLGVPFLPQPEFLFLLSLETLGTRERKSQEIMIPC